MAETSARIPEKGASNTDAQLRFAASAVIGAIVAGAIYFARPVLIPLALAILLAFALAPVAAFATPTPAQQASKDCASLRAKTGATAFVQAFGSAGMSNAFGKCVSKFAQAERANTTSANTLCSAEQADPNFAAVHGGMTFVAFYGKGNDKNAFGNCVSLKTQNSVKVEQGELNPAQTCTALRTRFGTTQFAQTFGTSENHRNAFGKCVSLVARFESTSVVNAASACLSELNDASFGDSHGGKTFAQFYGTNTDLSNAFGSCVAQKLQSATTKLQTSLATASKTCRAMRNADPSGFRNKYGNRPNAFAKCVVAHTQTK